MKVYTYMNHHSKHITLMFLLDASDLTFLAIKGKCLNSTDVVTNLSLKLVSSGN